MIVGNPRVFAVESEIRVAYARASALGLGFFVIHAGGLVYGVRSADATLLACSYDAVERRVASRGRHLAFFPVDADAGLIADAVELSIYSGEPGPFFGYCAAEFAQRLHDADLVWAPDGDEAFDDGSRVLHIDAGDRVRLIAFRTGADQRHDPATLRSVWLDTDEYYGVLRRWKAAFDASWAAMEKQPEQQVR